MTPKAADTQRRNNLLKRFGTTDILEILGPAGTIPPSQSIANRLAEYGINHTHSKQWAERYIPKDLYDALQPFQLKLRATHQRETLLSKYGIENVSQLMEVAEKRRATFEARFGGNPMQNPDIKAKYRRLNELKHGGHPLSLSPEEIYRRLALQELEPLEPIVLNSDKISEIRVRCKRENCGREFVTRWVSRLQPCGGHKLGFLGCSCKSHGTNHERYLLDYVQQRYPSAYSWHCIPWMNNEEIDIFIPELNIGFEINGYASHNSEVGYKSGRGKPKTPDFHRFKSQACLDHGIRLYHIWHSHDSDIERYESKLFVDFVLSGRKPELDDDMTISRDILPDPTIIGLPYEDLGPQQFMDPLGNICYTSGLWKFHPELE